MYGLLYASGRWLTNQKLLLKILEQSTWNWQIWLVKYEILKTTICQFCIKLYYKILFVLVWLLWSWYYESCCYKRLRVQQKLCRVKKLQKIVLLIILHIRKVEKHLMLRLLDYILAVDKSHVKYFSSLPFLEILSLNRKLCKLVFL